MRDILAISFFSDLFVNLITLAATAVGALLVGYRISHRWQMYQKDKERDLADIKRFYELYGQFFSLWKLWNYALRNGETSKTWDLLERSAAMEGAMESLLIRLASEKAGLTEEHIKTIGRIRQKFQLMRESIIKDRPIPWYSSETEDYVEFKRLSAEIIPVIYMDSDIDQISTSEKAQIIQKITSNIWEQPQA